MTQTQLPSMSENHQTAGHPLRSEGDPPAVVAVRDFSLFYGPKQALFNVSCDFLKNRVTALIGPSGCGKSTLLRSINRLQDLVPKVRMTGDMFLNDAPIYGRGVDVIGLRKHTGMVFQKPNPFPTSIYENVVYGLRLSGERNKQRLNEAVEDSLTQAALWNEVKDRLHAPAAGLSGGQQQRLCIARAIAVKPQVLLMDEPCSALDPISTARVEDLVFELKNRVTIVMVTHNLQQASRVADYTAFMYMGKLIELDATATVFTFPSNPMTEQYLTGRFG
ncbi:MAG: phosphate ABC transporter ATP-binding protein PstB [Tepidisphaeraceae bacterium]